MPENTSSGQSGRNQQGSSQTEGSGGAEGTAAQLRDAVGRQGAAAVETLKQSAQSLGEQARDSVATYAEGGRDAITEHLDTFAEAVRKASDELSQHDQTLAWQVVRQAAGGLESLSRSIHGVTFSDLLDSVRAFGRRNPAAFIGGAVLAGFAVGRFARASGQSIYDTDDWDSGPSRGPIRDSSGRFRSRGEWSEGRDESDDGPSGSRRYPSRSQGYAGGGMGSGSSGTAGQRSGGPSSDDDASVGTSAGAGGIGSGSISTGES